jgi:hypothetical protein
VTARLLLAAALLATSCLAPSAEEVQEKFNTFVDSANQCTAASDCAVVSPGCPLGCSVAVRADRKADVEAKAHDLISQYQRAGARCDYDCSGVGPLTCTAGRCAFGPLP